MYDNRKMNTATRVVDIWLKYELDARDQMGETINAELVHNILRLRQYSTDSPDDGLLQDLLSVAVEQVDCQLIAELYQ